MKKPVVLVVDDEPQILRVMRASLPIRGYEVLTVSSGEEALNQLSKQVPDLVILDLAMPEMSGLEVCRLNGSNHYPLG
jgi:two-component system KDP operon response regulator KdpE